MSFKREERGEGGRRERGVQEYRGELKLNEGNGRERKGEDGNAMSG